MRANNLFWIKNRERPSIGLAVNKTSMLRVQVPIPTIYSYSAAKVFMQVMFVTVTVPLGVTLYASYVGYFSMFTSGQLRLSVTHCCSTVPVL